MILLNMVASIGESHTDNIHRPNGVAVTAVTKRLFFATAWSVLLILTGVCPRRGEQQALTKCRNDSARVASPGRVNFPNPHL